MWTRISKIDTFQKVIAYGPEPDRVGPVRVEQYTNGIVGSAREWRPAKVIITGGDKEFTPEEAEQFALAVIRAANDAREMTHYNCP